MCISAQISIVYNGKKMENKLYAKRETLYNSENEWAIDAHIHMGNSHLVRENSYRLQNDATSIKFKNNKSTALFGGILYICNQVHMEMVAKTFSTAAAQG